MSENSWEGKLYGLSRWGEGLQRGSSEWCRMRDQRQAEVEYWRAIWASQGWGQKRRPQDGRRSLLTDGVGALRGLVFALVLEGVLALMGLVGWGLWRLL